MRPRHPPTMRGGLLVRAVWLVFGLFLFALGLVGLLGSELGLAPWDVLNQGLERNTPLTFGTANIAVAILVIAMAVALGSTIGPGTIANAILVGTFVDLLVAAEVASSIAEAPTLVRWLALVTGIWAVAIGSALYIGAAMGAGPRDSLMLITAERGGVRVGVSRAVIESSVTLIGFALGGTVGVGTLAFAFGIGPAVEVCFALVGRSRLAHSKPEADPEVADPADVVAGI